MEVYSANIENIKSPYILGKLLSLLWENKKLDLLMHDKRLQRKMKISIKDYRKIRYKYKIAERNGLGKEYLINTNIIIFEGEYLNGRRNGKGKEYYENGKLKFEGEFINGIKIEGIGYDIEGKIKFNIKRR